MPNLTFDYLCYTQLNSMTWCATAQFIVPSQLRLWSTVSKPLSPSTPFPSFIDLRNLYWQIEPTNQQLSLPQIAHNKRQQQRSGVRILLDTLLDKLGISDTLDESQFPYRLVNSHYYVCFSHSQDKVAVVISHHRAVGIDIETQNIPWHVVQRFYHTAELSILAKLSEEQRILVSKRLWQLKESFIKIYQYKLAQGLGMDYSYLITNLILADDHSTIICDDHSDESDPSYQGYQILVLSEQQTIIIF